MGINIENNKQKNNKAKREHMIQYRKKRKYNAIKNLSWAERKIIAHDSFKLGCSQTSAKYNILLEVVSLCRQEFKITGKRQAKPTANTDCTISPMLEVMYVLR